MIVQRKDRCTVATITAVFRGSRIDSISITLASVLRLLFLPFRSSKLHDEGKYMLIIELFAFLPWMERLEDLFSDHLLPVQLWMDFTLKAFFLLDLNLIRLEFSALCILLISQNQISYFRRAKEELFFSFLWWFTIPGDSLEVRE